MVRELNEGVKRIYADMQEQNLEDPIFTENNNSVILILKNNIGQINEKQIITANVGGNNGGDYGGHNTISETKVIDEIRKNEKISVQQISENTAISKRSVERIIRSLKDRGILIRQGTKNGKWIIIK